MAHSSGQPMECEAVDGRLLDLVEGELEPTDAQSIRAHVETCAECGRALARLEGGRAIARKLEVVEPRAGLLDAVRAAARARASEVVRESAPSPREAAVEDAPRAARPREREVEPDRAWWGELLRWLGSMAMGPQVAMATLLVLMVGIGLWSIPSLRGRGASSTAVLEPDTAGEVGPSAGGLEPAEPLAFDFDPRTRRLEPIGDRRDEPESGAIQPAPVVRPEVLADRGRARVAPPPASEAEERAPQQEQAALDDGDDDGALALAEIEAAIAPGESVGGLEAQRSEAQVQPRAATSAAASVERQSPIAMMPQPRGSGAESTARAPSAQRYEQHTDDDGIAPAQPDGETLVASALHRQARAAAARGAHADCVRQYEALAARHPSYGESGRALVELAECQRRLGQLTAAARTLERAQQHASVRADATRELARVRMAERAAEVQLDEPAAAERAPVTTSSE